ncbi:MAG: hypothetical protein IPM82_22525 [Saprospiraceae bacterium]|nr:hypothetical protein [Saprospiraceae bacterium]
MKKNLLLAVAICFTMLASCDLFDDSPCGPNQTYDLYLLGSSIVDSATGVYYSYMDSGNRVFQWSNIVENVCSQEHVKIDARVALLDETTTGISARSSASWLFLFEEQITMTKNGSDIKGKGEAGLKQAFGEDPAWFVPTLEVFFQTKGSYGADTAFLKQNVISVEMMAKYRKH